MEYNSLKFVYIEILFFISLFGRCFMSFELDRYDRMILTILQKQGRISNQELAEAINLSPSSCLRRVKQMEEQGLIDAYVALLNAKKLGLTLMAFIGISMDKHTPERFDHVEQTLSSYPEVLECHLITGQTADFLLKVIVRDMDAYQHFLLQKLTRMEGVTGVHTSFVMKSTINSTALAV